MENTITVSTPLLSSKCTYCYSKTVEDDVYCANCGYPLKGTEFEQKTFIAEKEVLDINLADYNSKVKKAGNTLYYLSGVFVLNAIISFFMNKDSEDVLSIVITLLVLAILFLALGGYSRKKPLACLVSGLCLYIIVLVLFAIDNPINIFSGIIFKIFIIGYLIKGIKSAIEVEKIKKENNIA